MEWVIAVLGVGCVFFAAQVVVDFITHKRAIEPRLEKEHEEVVSQVDEEEKNQRRPGPI